MADEPIQQGFEVFVSDDNKPFGAVREVSPHGRPELVVYVENAGDFTIALGGCVSENLALHGTLFSWSMSDPDVDFEGTDLGELDGSLSMSAYGGGVTYFIMPANVYLSGNIGMGFLTLDTDFGDDTSDPGIALDLSVGKEWWVGNSWGLGLAGAFGYHSIDDFSGWNAGVRFSATFN